jgi:hypothetical protein
VEGQIEEIYHELAAQVKRLQESADELRRRFYSRSFRQPGTPGARPLVVQNDAEESRVDLEATVVFDEPQFPELVHEKVHARSCRPDHVRQCFLRDPRYRSLRAGLIGVPRQQQKRPREPLLAGVEQLVDEVRFDADVPRSA